MATRGAKAEQRNIAELEQTADEVLARESRVINRKVADRSPAATKAQQESIERDMAIQMKAWQANP